MVVGGQLGVVAFGPREGPVDVLGRAGPVFGVGLAQRPLTLTRACREARGKIDRDNVAPPRRRSTMSMDLGATFDRRAGIETFREKEDA